MASIFNVVHKINIGVKMTVIYKFLKAFFSRRLKVVVVVVVVSAPMPNSEIARFGV
jgi:hypothetical protein